jgi:DNA topoisomerase-2
MDRIDVTIDTANNSICIRNNGKGVPVEIHKEHKIYIPELIFGHLLTSSNFNDEERKVTGGRNGYGAKLTNIYSKTFIVETADRKRKKRFTKTWTNNMMESTEAEIDTNYTGDDFTQITFYPDLPKFKMRTLDQDTLNLLRKRVYDIAGVTNEKIKVYYNGKKVPVNNFKEYVQLYEVEDDGNGLKTEDGEKDKSKPNEDLIHEIVNGRWELCVRVSDGKFQQVSFVNSICTSRGGTHIDLVTDQITKNLSEILKKKSKDLKIKPFQIKQHLQVFLNTLIENPSFDSQSKETLTLEPAEFGSECELSEKFLKKISKSSVIEHILAAAQAKERVKMSKALSGKKKTRLLGIPKLEDANWAGSNRSRECLLILTEGDSAKSLAMAGVGTTGRNKFGVFPLKGKLLNVREASNSGL